MSDQNGDANGNTSTEEAFITVSDLAEQIGVPLPRLMRILKRSQFVGHVEQRDRRTRTGTRTVTVVSVSVLGELETILREPFADATEHKRKQEQPEALPSGVVEAEGPTFAEFVEMQRRAEVAEARAALLEVALDREADAHKRAEVLHLGTQGQLEALRARAAELESMNRRLIEALPTAPADDQGPVPAPTGDTYSDRSAEPDDVPAPAGPTVEEIAELVAETVRRAEQAEGKLMVANDTIARERAEKEATARALQAMQEKAERPWWKKIFGGGR